MSAYIILHEGDRKLIYSWLRTQNYNPQLAKQLAFAKEVRFDIYSDAIELYEYLIRCGDVEVELSVSDKTRVSQIPAANCFTEEDIEAEEKYEKELLNIDMNQLKFMLDSKKAEYEKVKHYNDSPSTIILAAEIALLKKILSKK